MEEKRSDSRSSNDTEQYRNETTVTGELPDEPDTGKLLDGGWTYVTQAHYDPEKTCDLTTVIIGAIAEAEGVPLTSIKEPPLYEVVDVAAIDSAMFGRPTLKQNGATSSVEFCYNQYMVSVEADGWVTLNRQAGGVPVDDE